MGKHKPEHEGNPLLAGPGAGTALAGVRDPAHAVVDGCGELDKTLDTLAEAKDAAGNTYEKGVRLMGGGNDADDVEAWEFVEEDGSPKVLGSTDKIEVVVLNSMDVHLLEGMSYKETITKEDVVISSDSTEWKTDIHKHSFKTTKGNVGICVPMPVTLGIGVSRKAEYTSDSKSERSGMRSNQTEKRESIQKEVSLGETGARHVRFRLVMKQKIVRITFTVKIRRRLRGKSEPEEEWVTGEKVVVEKISDTVESEEISADTPAVAGNVTSSTASFDEVLGMDHPMVLDAMRRADDVWPGRKSVVPHEFVRAMLADPKVSSRRPKAKSLTCVSLPHGSVF